MSREESNVERAVLQHLKQGCTPLLQRIRECNRIVLHNYQATVARVYTCGLEGCESRFEVTLIPNQILYPKYCPEHRTQHRRRHFLNKCSGVSLPAHP